MDQKECNNGKLPLVQSLPNHYQDCTIVMTSALFRREGLVKAFLSQKVGTALMLLWDGRIQYLDRVDWHGGRLHVSNYAAINECTPRKVKWPTQWTHKHTLTLMHEDQAEVHAYRHSQQEGHSTHCVKKRYLKGDLLPVAKEHTYGNRHTRAKIHTYTWGSINLQETRAIAMLVLYKNWGNSRCFSGASQLRYSTAVFASFLNI